ncbi:hypothetical protein TNIN_216151 [Trichonephila inaurata madagascariensis]|uniref:Uncharacterized protein n=1 Tax=Trichonephila inaurata madagascariensis TaxID=2747483 RepID=A0A8X6YUP1_9ARAC|nr:hypothetical protein TNIN_216151 [Trichonephila inaurata madagascariensis]
MQNQCVVDGPPCPTSECAGISMETCGVPSAVALGPLSSVYPTYELYLLQFVYFLKSLHDTLRNSVLGNSWPSGSPSITSAASFFQISLLDHVEIAEYVSHVFGNDFDDKQARLLRNSSHFGSTVSPIHRRPLQAESFCWSVEAPIEEPTLPFCFYRFSKLNIWQKAFCDWFLDFVICKFPL